MTITRLPGVRYASEPRTADPRYASMLSQPPRLIVIHDTSNDATREQEASYAANRTDSSDRWTSAHFYVDDGGVLGSVPLNLRAWAAYAYANRYGIHIEMCGYNTGHAGAVTARTIAITARLVAQLAQVFNIPLVKLSPAEVAAGKRGICGHYDVTIGLDVGDHDDPGPKFNWPAFMRAVTQGEDMLKDETIALPQYAGNTQAQANAATAVAYTLVRTAATYEAARRIEAGQAAILAAIKGDSDTEVIIAEIRAQAAAEAEARAQERTALVADVVATLTPLLQSGPVTQDELEAALRAVLGSVDGASPAE